MRGTNHYTEELGKDIERKKLSFVSQGISDL